MTRKQLDIGVGANDGTGESIRDSMLKIESNFSELYELFGNLLSTENELAANSANSNFTISTSGSGRLIVSQGTVINDEEQNLPTAIMSNDGGVQIYSDPVLKRTGINTNVPTTSLSVVGNANVTGEFSAASDVDLGSSDGDQITVNGKLYSSLVPGVSGYNLGAADNPWDDLYTNAITATSIAATNITATVFTGDITGDVAGQLTTADSIRILDGAFISLINTENLTGNRAVEFPNANGVLVVKQGARLKTVYGNPPASAIGTMTDTQGDLAFDDEYIYYCHGVYDGSSTIWKRASLAAW